MNFCKSSLFLICLFTVLTPFITDISASEQNETDIEYKLFKKAGVKIPIRDLSIDENVVVFEIYRKDISLKDYIWSSIWSKDFGYYMLDADMKSKDKECPFISKKDKLPGSKIEDIGNGKHKVTLVLYQDVIDAVIQNKCAVSPKPKKSPKLSDVVETEKETKELFPTIR